VRRPNSSASIKAEAERILTGERAYAVGKPLDISFTAVDGRIVDLKNMKGKIFLVYGTCKNADNENKESETVISEVKDGVVYLRVKVSQGAVCEYSYSFDGRTFTNINEKFVAEKGRWIGAKAGMFCTGETQTNDAGYADFDWLRVEPLAK